VKFVRLIVRNLARNRRRNLLTLFSIAFSLFIFSALMSVPLLLSQLTFGASSQRLLCFNKASITYPLPESYKRKIAAIPHVTAIAAEKYFGGTFLDATNQFPNSTVDASEIDRLFPDWDLPRAEIQQFKIRRTSCLVGVATMSRFNWKIGQQITLRGTIYPVNPTLKIVGTLGKKFQTAVIFHREYLEELLGDHGMVNDFWIRLDNPSAASAVIAQIDETFANSEYETHTQSEESFMHEYLANLATFFTVARVLGLIVVAVICVIAGNAAAMTMRERRREIAILRSLGYGQHLILITVLAETLIVALTGGLVGCGIAYALFSLAPIGSAALMQYGVIRMPPSVLIEAIAISALLGILSALPAAAIATRGSIVDKLRAAA